jgi:O-antigen ligase
LTICALPRFVRSPVSSFRSQISGFSFQLFSFFRSAPSAPSVPSYPVRPPSPKANLVTAFRGEVRASAPLHPLERALVIWTCLHLCFLVWAVGGRSPWIAYATLGFGVVAFVLALWPRRYTGELAPEGDFTLHTWPRVLKFPLFWIGLGFLGYILIGALNPAWERVSEPPYWYIEARPHQELLPTSVAAPFEKMNAWRLLAIYGACWLVMTALWAGLTRRAAAQAILTVLVVNGFVLSLLAITQKMAGATEMLWFIKVPAAYFHGTFIYKNHAGAYFNLLLVVTLGLAIWHHVRSLRRLERGSPAPVFAFAVVVMAACVFMSGSRTAMLLLAAYLVISLVIYLVWRSRNRAGPGNPAVSGMLAVCTAALIAASAYFLNLDNSIEQIRLLTTEQGHRAAVEFRVQARNATWDLFRDQPLTGWGAGSFRHAFPIHQQNYPEIFRAGAKNTFFWDHAHNDYVQALAELGVLGFLFPVAGLFWLLYKLIRLGSLAHPAFLLITFGLGLTLAHAWVDFPLYNVAILTTFCTVWAAVVRWAELEHRG